MIELSMNKIISLHKSLALATGGQLGIKDEEQLAKAIEKKYQTLDGREVYPTIEEKAAKLGYSLILNHAFFDGRKRLGMYAMLILLEVNGIKISCDNDDIINVGRAVAAEEMSYEQLHKWILEHRID